VNEDGSLYWSTRATIGGRSIFEYAEKTLGYLYELWKKPVHLKTFSSQNKATSLTYTTSGMEVGK
jgi:spore cortex formation protein SpoVR/YcgB (stage V sporulation)